MADNPKGKRAEPGSKEVSKDDDHPLEEEHREMPNGADGASPDPHEEGDGTESQTASGQKDSEATREEERRYSEEMPDALTLIEDLKEGGRYRGIINAIKNLRSSMDEKIHTRLHLISEQRIENAQKSLSDLEEELGRKFEELREYVDKAMMAIADGDYNSVESFLDAFNRVKEEQESFFLRERYEAELVSAKNDLEMLREAGIELPETENDLESASEELSEGHYDAVRVSLSGLTQLITEARTIRAKNVARNRFAEVKATFDRLKRDGMELKEEKNLFREAMMAIKSKDFLKGCRLLRKTQRMLDELAIDREKEELITQLEEYRDFVSLIEAQGYFSAGYRGTIIEALSHLDGLIRGERIKEAKDEMVVFSKIIGDLHERMEKYERVEELLRELQSLLDEASSLGINVGREMDILEDARAKKESDDLDDVFHLLSRCKTSLLDKMEHHRREEAAELLRKAKEAIETNRDAITDPSKLNLHMLNANTYFAQRKYEQSIKTSSGIIDMIKEVKEEHSIGDLKQLIGEAERYIEENKQQNIKVFESEALYYKAKFYFEQKDFIEARKYVKGSIDCALRDRREVEKKKAASPLQEARQSMKELGRIGGELTGVTKVIESAQRYFDAGKFREAEEWATLARKDVEAAIKGRYEEMVQKINAEIEILVTTASDFDLDVSKETSAMEEAHGLVQEGKYGEAIETLKSAKSTLEMSLESGIRIVNRRKIERAEDELRAFQEEWNRDFEDLEQYLQMLRGAFDDASYDILDLYIVEFNKAKQRHNNLLLALRYTQRVADLEPDLKKFKRLGIDISETDVLVANVTQNISDFYFDRADENLKALFDFIGDIRNVRAKKLASEHFKKAKDTYLRMKNQSIPMDSARDHLKSTMEAINSRDYIQAIEMTFETENALRDAQNDYNKSEAMSFLEEIRSLKEQMREFELELDLSTVDRAVEKANAKLDVGMYEDAKDVAQEARTTVKDLVEGAMLALVESRVGGLDPIIEAALEIDADIKVEMETISGWDVFKEKKQFRIILDRIDETAEAIGKKREIKLGQLNSKKIYVAANALLSLQDETGWPLDELQDYLNRAQEALESNDFETVDNFLNEFFMEKTERKNQYYREKFEEELERIIDKNNLLAEIGVRIPEVDEILPDVKDAISGNRFDESKAGVERLKEVIEEARSVRTAEILNSYLGRAKELFVQLRETDLPLKEEKALFKKAVELGRAEDSVEASKLALQVIEKLGIQKEGHLKEILISGIGEVEGFYEEMKAHEYFSKDAKRTFRRSRDEVMLLYSRKEIAAAKEKMDRLMERMSEMKRTIHFYDRTKELYSDVKGLLKEAMELVIGVDGELQRISEAETARDEERFEDATTLLQEVHGQLRLKIDTRKAVEAKRAMDAAAEIYADSADVFEDVDAIKGILKNARDLYEKGDFTQATEVSEELVRTVRELREKKIIEDQEILLRETRALIDENDNLGIEIFQSDALYYKARYHFARKEYDQAKEYCVEAKANARGCRDEFRKSRAERSLSEAFDLLKKAPGMGLDVTPLKEKLKEARARIDAGDFDVAAELSSQVKEELSEQHVRRRKEQLSSELEEISDFLANLAGIPVLAEHNKNQLNKVFSETRELYRDNKLSEAQNRISSLKKDMERLNKAIEEYHSAAALISDVEELIRKSEDIRMDIDNEMLLVREAREMMAKFVFGEAVPLLKEAKDSLSNRIEIVGMKRAQSLLERAVAVVEENRDIVEGMTEIENFFSMATTYIESKQYSQATGILSELIDMVGEARSRKRIEELNERRNLLEEMILGSESEGIEVPRSRDLLTRGQEALSKKNLDEAEIHLAEAQRTVERTRKEFFRKSAYFMLTQAQEGLRELSDLGRKSDRLVEGVRNIQFLLGEMSYQDARKKGSELLEKITTERNAYFEDRAKKTMEAITGELEKGREVGLDPSEIDERMKECSTLLEAGKYEESLRHAELTHGFVKDLIKRKLKENFQSKIDGLRAAIGEARMMSIDVTNEIEALRTVEEMIRDERYKDIPDIVLSNKVSVDEKIAKHRKESNKGKLTRVKEEFSSFDQMTGGSFSDVRSFVELAEKAFVKEDYEAQDSFIQEFRKLRTDHEKKYRKEKLAEGVRDLEAEIAEIDRIGFDTTELGEIIEMIRSSIEELDFQGAKRELARVQAAVEHIKTVDVRNKVRILMRNVEEIFDEVMEVDLDVSVELAENDRIVQVFESGDFIRAHSMADNLSGRLQKARDEYYRKEILSILEGADEKVAVASELGLDTGHAKNVIADCRSRIEERSLTDSRELAQRIHDEIAAMVKNKLAQVVQTQLPVLKLKIEKAGELGVDIREEYQSIALISDMFAAKKYDKAREIIEFNMHSIRKKELKKKRDELGKRIDKADKARKSLSKETGREYRDLNTLLEESQTALSEDDFELAGKRLDTFFKFRARHHDQVLSEKYSAQLSGLERKFSTVKGLGMDTREAEELVSSTKENIFKTDFEAAATNVSRLENYLTEATTVRAKEMAKELLSNGKDVIERLRKMGRDVKEDTKPFKKAVALMKESKFVEACRICRDNNNKLEELYLEDLRGNIITGMIEIREFFTRLIKTEHFSPDYKEKVRRDIESVESALIGDRLDEARVGMAQLTEAITRTKRRMKEFERASSLLERNGKLRERATEAGIDIALEGTILKEVDRLRSEWKLNEAIPILEEANASLENKLDLRRIEGANESFNRMIAEVEENRDVFEDAGHIEDLIAKAKKHLENKQYDDFMKINDNILRTISETKEKRIIDETSTILVNAVQLIERNRKLGIDIFKSESLVSKARFSIEKRNFEQALSTARSALDRTQSDKRAYDKKNASSSLADVWEKISKSLEKGLEVTEIEDVMSKAQALFREGSYEESNEAAQEARNMLEQAWEKHQAGTVQSLQTKIDSLSEEARELGLDVARFTTSVEKCSSLVKKGKYEDAESLSRETRAALEEIIDNRLSDILKERLMAFTADMDRAKKAGFSVEEEAKVIGVIKKLYEKSKFRKGIQTLSGIEKSVSEKLREHEKKVYSGKIAKAEKDIEDFEGVSGGHFKELHSQLFNLKEALEGDGFGELASNLESLYRSLEECQVRFYSKKYSDDIAEIEEGLGDLTEVGLDVAEIEKLLHSAKKSIPREDITSARKSLDNARTRYEQARTDGVKEVCLDRLKMLGEKIEDMEQSDVDTTEGEKKLAMITEMIEDEAYLQACIIANETERELAQTLEMHFTTLFSGIKVNLAKMMSLAREYGLSIDDISELASKAQSVMDENRHEDGYRAIMAAKALLQERMDEEFIKRIRDRLKTVDATVDGAKEKGMDVNAEVEKLSRIGDLEKDGKRHEILTLLDEVKASLDRKVRESLIEENIPRLDRARGELQELRKRTGDELTDLAQLFDAARKAMDGGNGAEVEGALASFFELKSVLEEDFERERFTKELHEHRKEIKDLEELGVDLSHAHGIVKELEKDIGKAPLSKIKDPMGEISSLLEYARNIEVKNLAKELFTSTKELFKELSVEKLPLEEEKKTFKKAMAALKKQDYKSGIDLTNRTRTKLLDARKNFLMGRTSTSLKDVQRMMDEDRGLGVDVAPVEKIINRVLNLVEAQDFKEAKELVENARSTLSRARNDFFIQQAITLLKELNGIMEGAAVLGMDTSPMMRAAKGAQASIDSDKGKEAFDLLDGELPRIKRSVEERRRGMADEKARAREDILERIGKATSSGDMTREFLEHEDEDIRKAAAARFEELKLAEENRREEERRKAEEAAKKKGTALSHIQKTRRSSEITEDLLGHSDKEVRDAAASRMEELKAREGALERISGAMESRLIADDLLGHPDEEVRSAAAVKLKELKEREEKEAERTREEVKKKAEETAKLKEIEEEEAARIRKEDKKKAEAAAKLKESEEKEADRTRQQEKRMAEEAVKEKDMAMLRISRAASTSEITVDLLEHADEEVREAASLRNGELKAAEETERARKEALENLAKIDRSEGITDELLNHPDAEVRAAASTRSTKLREAEEARSEADRKRAEEEAEKDLEKRKLQEEAQKARNMVEDTEVLIREVAGLGIEIFRSEAMMFKAKFALDNRRYQEALKYCQEARKLAVEVKRVKDGEVIRIKLEDARKLLSTIENMGVEVSDFRSRLDGVEEDLRGERLDDAGNMLDTIYEELAASREKRLEDEFETRYSRLEELFERARKNGIDVEEESKNSKSLPGYRDERKYAEGMERIGELIERLERKLYEKVHVEKIDKLDNALQELDNLKKETGGDFEVLEGYLNGATDSLKSRNYEDFDSLLDRFFEEKEGRSEEFFVRKLERTIEEIRSTAKQLEKMGLDVSSLLELVRSAADGMTKSEMDLVKGIISDARQTLDDLMGKPLVDLAKKHFARAKLHFGRLKDEGIPAPDGKKLLQRVIQAFRDKEYLSGGLLAMETEKTLEESLRTFREEERVRKIMDKVTGLMDEIMEMTVEASERDLDTALARDRVDLARFRLDEKKYEDAEEMLLKAKGELIRMMEGEKKGEFQLKLNDLDLLLSVGGNNEMDIGKEQASFEEIKAIGADGRFREGLRKIMEVLETLKARIREELYIPRDVRMKGALQVLAAYQQDVGEAGVEDLRGYLTRAREALEKQRFLDVDSLLEEFETMKEANTKDYYLKKHEKRLDEIAAEVRILDNAGVAVGSLTDHVERMRDSIRQGEVEEAAERLERAETLLVESRSALAKKAETERSETQSLLETVREKGGEVGEVETSLRDANSFMKKREFAEAIAAFSSARESLNYISMEVDRRLEEEKAGEERERAEMEEMEKRARRLEEERLEEEERKRAEEAERIERDMETEEEGEPVEKEEVEEEEMSVESGEIQKVAEKKVMADVEEEEPMGEEPEPEDPEELVAVVRMLISEAKAMGVDIGLNMDRITLAESRLREGKAAGARELASVAKREIERLIGKTLGEKPEEEELLKPGKGVEKGPSLDLSVIEEMDLEERKCPNCRKVSRGRRCVHCGTLMVKPEKKKGTECKLCSGELKEEDDKLVCADCGGEFDLEGNIILPEEPLDVSEIVPSYKTPEITREVEEPEAEEPEAGGEEEAEEVEEDRSETGQECELCGVELERKGDFMVCPICAVEYTAEGDVSVSKGAGGPECELCGSALEAKGDGMHCPMCEAEYDARGNFISIIDDDEAYGTAIEKMISSLETDETEAGAGKEVARRKKVVRKAVKKALQRKPVKAAEEKPEKRAPATAVKKGTGKKAPIKKGTGKKAPIKKGTLQKKKALPKKPVKSKKGKVLAKKKPKMKKSDKKKPVLKKKPIPKKSAKKGKKGKEKGPSWDELKTARKKKGKKGKKVEYDEPAPLSFIKKKKK